jgi:hypothetical protein
MANVHVKTSTSGRRFVEIDEVIKRRLAEIKKNRNGNGHSKSSSGEALHKGDTKSAAPAKVGKNG